MEELLDVRLCDLDIQIAGSRLDRPLARLADELARRSIRFRPHFWLSDEWFSPQGVGGVAIPFYLAHPRLMRLEWRQMLEVEGGPFQECMKILRHETGHAIHHAYQLHRRRRAQRAFGRSSVPYPDYYRPNPGSRRHVHYLDLWYAQSHPDEDFAETFAVWLDPRSQWRRHYAGWPALRKLEVMEEIMRDVASTPPRVRGRPTPDSLRRLRHTLRTHYAAKKERYSVGYGNAYDREIRQIFTSEEEAPQRGSTAAAFIRRHRQELRDQVCRWTGEHQFTVDQVLKQMIGRCRELKLRAVGAERRLKSDFAIILTAHTMHYVYRGREWHPL